MIIDAARADRALALDCWYPAVDDDEQPLSVYELLPGIGFTAWARADAAPAPGAHPLVLFSHGRLGTRSSYAMLCEGLAARGFVVIAPDHPGDTLTDWLTGAAVDDATNEVQRVADLRFVLETALGAGSALAGGAGIDGARIAAVGHSYGGYSALALAGVEPGEPRLAAVAGMQAFTRTLPAAALRRITAPTLLIVGSHDASCPPETDADRAYALLTASAPLRVDIAHAGHQGCSDVGLYLELEPLVDGVPDLVAEFLHGLADQVTGSAGDPWRPTVELHLRTVAAWLDSVLDRNIAQASNELDELRRAPGVTMHSTTSV